jgi:hypothetical protein
MVMRLDVYVGERDVLGIGFSDNVIFRKQYYLRVVAGGSADLSESLDGLEVWLYTGEDFADTAGARKLEAANGEWRFDVEGTGFQGTLGFTVARVEG